MIEISQLTRRFGSFTAVQDLSIEIRPGEVFGFLGPNGAGKTTTLKILAGMIRPSSGWARIHDLDVTTESLQVKQSLGVVFADPKLFPNLTARETLGLVAQTYGLDGDWESRGESLLERLGLAGAEHAKKYASEFSLGMRKKLALASALLPSPRALLLDEPTSSLDPGSVREVERLLETAKAEGVAVLLCSHFLDWVEAQCDRVALIHRGRMVALGTPRDVVTQFGDQTGKHRSLRQAFLAMLDSEVESKDSTSTSADSPKGASIR